MAEVPGTILLAQSQPVANTCRSILLLVNNKVELAHPVAMGRIQREQAATPERFLQRNT